MKLFDWLLAVYPRGFRERFGAGMRAAFTEDYARARASGRLAGLLLSQLPSLARSASGSWNGFLEQRRFDRSCRSMCAMPCVPSGPHRW